MRLVISKKLWWIWGRRFENNLSFLKMASPPPPQQMNDQPSDSKNRPTKPVVFKICLKGSLWRCKKGHTFWKLTVQLTRFAACEIKREIVKETNRGPRGMARRSIVNILSRHWYRTLPHCATKTRQLQSWFVHISLLYFWWFRRQLLYVMWNHLISRSTMCFIVPPLQSQLNHSTLHWTICVWLKPFVSRLHRSTLHWTICVWLEPLVNVWVTSYFTQIITQQSSWPFVFKLGHFAHGILVDYNLNKPILVWRYRFNIYQWTAPHLTKSFVV